ncbi:MAG: VOC family protein [Pyrinomonadaceae bacterium]|nr:VOC family protein [Pyrinomonadaceae bacterium]
MSQEASGFAGPGHGEFCWTEIASNDSAKAKEFYTNVFGWTFQDSNAATDGFAYHEFSTGGGYPAGGLYQITPEMCAPGEPLPPPHFLTYIAVDDVDANAKRAVELGGTVIKSPDDIPKTGRFAIIADPTGAMFSIFKMAEGGHNG